MVCKVGLVCERFIPMADTETIIDPMGLRAAIDAVGDHLGHEAEGQQAYLHKFADGKVSLELEWIDLCDMVRTAITAYLRTARGSPLTS